MCAFSFHFQEPDEVVEQPLGAEAEVGVARPAGAIAQINAEQIYGRHRGFGSCTPNFHSLEDC